MTLQEHQKQLKHDHVPSLGEIGLFSDLKDSAEALAAISKIMIQRDFEVGQNIIQEGTEGAELFILREGQVSVYKKTPGGDEYKVAILSSHQHVAFGENGLIQAEQRSATIRADTLCHCLVLGRKEFEDFGRIHPEWALPIFRRLAIGILTRLKKTNNDMLLLYHALVDEIRGR